MGEKEEWPEVGGATIPSYWLCVALPDPMKNGWGGGVARGFPSENTQEDKWREEQPQGGELFY